MIQPPNTNNETDGRSDHIFERIVTDINTKGYSINQAALPSALGNKLAQYLNTISGDDFDHAGIGRDLEVKRDELVRGDEICWITGESDAGKDWLHWIAEMQLYINRGLFLGLFSFESHFSHYATGDFYRRHYDAFKGQANRVLSMVVYLNSDWTQEDGGELVLYTNSNDVEGITVTPSFGTVVVFLSEDFPHEVLTTHRDRYSIAGWFRINSSTNDRADPPS
ncbi:MAG: 2OG-Fe(II) oxygenase [Moraxellaceae bacterium]|nr:MAG: 2OG-Fe(II) oxygenase [Moraxellaceae bacterium]